MNQERAGEELRFFTSSNFPWGRALLLEGDWGVGKTFLWNHHSDEPRPHVYVSAFGAENGSELLRRIVGGFLFNESQHIRELFQGHLSDHAGKISKWSVSRFVLRKAQAEDVLPRMSLIRGIPKQSIIIIDDYERKQTCFHDMDFLGVVYQLLDVTNAKVVVIGNLSRNAEILPESQGAERPVAHQIEKVFHMRIKLDPNPSLMLESRLRSMDDGLTRRTLSGARSRIQSIFNKTAEGNMRTLDRLINHLHLITARLGQELSVDCCHYLFALICSEDQIRRSPDKYTNINIATLLVESVSRQVFQPSPVDSEQGMSEQSLFVNKYWNSLGCKFVPFPSLVDWISRGELDIAALRDEMSQRQDDSALFRIRRALQDGYLELESDEISVLRKASLDFLQRQGVKPLWDVVRSSSFLLATDDMVKENTHDQHWRLISDAVEQAVPDVDDYSQIDGMCSFTESRHLRPLHDILVSVRQKIPALELARTERAAIEMLAQEGSDYGDLISARPYALEALISPRFLDELVRQRPQWTHRARLYSMLKHRVLERRDDRLKQLLAAHFAQRVGDPDSGSAERYWLFGMRSQLGVGS